jgi:single-strand DNA-binding protein
MSAQLNRVILAGNLIRNPETRRSERGDIVTELNVATNRKWKNAAGEEKSESCFVVVDVWGKQAESAEKYLKKGSAVLIDGRLEFNAWKGKDGQQRTMLKVHAERLQFLDAREEAA